MIDLRSGIWFEILPGRLDEGGHQLILGLVRCCLYGVRLYLKNHVLSILFWNLCAAFSSADLFMCFVAGINVSPLCEKDILSFVWVVLVRLIMLWLSV